MKKFLLTLTILAMAVPAFAVVTITAEDAGSGQLRILLQSDIGVRGISVDISCSDGAYIRDDQDIVSWDASFNCVPDFANTQEGITPDSYTLGMAGSHPLATAGANPGVLPAGANASNFSVCMGYLDENDATDDDGDGENKGDGKPANATALELITLQLIQGSADSTVVTITADVDRGGIVGDAGAATVSGTTVVFAVAADCVKADAPFYTEWVGAGKNWDKPDCWCYERNCRGDIDGVKVGLYWVQTNDLGTFIAAFNKGDLKMDQTLICADLDHKKVGLYRCQTNDLTEFIKHFNKGQLKVPVCPLDWDADGDDDYNGWITP
jgi:hypothetical protein